MLLFVELSVDLRKGKSAKDGLYQYKNIAQNTNVGTIEVSIRLRLVVEDVMLTAFIDGAEEIHRPSRAESNRGTSKSG
jgi:translation initiation factor 3 subunit A